MASFNQSVDQYYNRIRNYVPHKSSLNKSFKDGKPDRIYFKFQLISANFRQAQISSIHKTLSENVRICSLRVELKQSSGFTNQIDGECTDASMLMSLENMDLEVYINDPGNLTMPDKTNIDNVNIISIARAIQNRGRLAPPTADIRNTSKQGCLSSLLRSWDKLNSWQFLPSHNANMSFFHHGWTSLGKASPCSTSALEIEAF